MSGHSKWASIKHKKGAADAKRGKVFTQHAKQITLAAQSGGGDVDMNPSLRLAIDNAKKDNVPNANIDRAVKKGSGEEKGAAQIVEVVYEGYGPEGTALLIKCLTDNKMRTLPVVKTIMNKKGGRMGESGSVGWMFKHKGLIQVDLEGKNADEIELIAIEAGADDTSQGSNFLEIYTQREELAKVKDALEEEGVKTESAELIYLPDNEVKVTDLEKAKKILNLMEALEESEEVSNIYSNFDISEEILEKL